MNNPPTIKECLQQAQRLLQPLSDSPRLDAEVLLGFVLEKNRTWLYTWSDKAPTSEQYQQFQKIVAEREQGKPVAHLTGEKEFWSLPLKVNTSTLIPRGDTETLVEVALDLAQALLQKKPQEHIQILDLGTGTGAIALALASELPTAKITAVDKMPQAVELAESNRSALGFTNVEVLQSDWFDALTQKKFHIIVSNPPYIDEHDPHLKQGDVRFEPLTALVAPNQGLADIEHITKHAKQHLLPNGFLCVEHGWQQAEAVRSVLEKNGYVEVRSEKDYGGNDRVTLGVVG